MIMLEELWLIPLGFVAGILGSMIGLGGGIIIVPVLTFVGFSPTLAVSNSLFAVFSNSVASTAIYAKQKRIEISLGWKLGLIAVPGTVLGAFISSDLSPTIFKILFALVLLSSASYIFLKRKIEKKPLDTSRILLVFSAGASFFCRNNIQSFWSWGWSNLCTINGASTWNFNETRSAYITVYLDVCIFFWVDRSFYSRAS